MGREGTTILGLLVVGKDSIVAEVVVAGWVRTNVGIVYERGNVDRSTCTISVFDMLKTLHK